MDDVLIFSACTTAAGNFALRYLQEAGVAVTHDPTPEVSHLLMDVPSFSGVHQLRDGRDLREILDALPRGIRIIGGNLRNSLLEDYQTIDLLADGDYLAENAAITADCAVRVAAPLLKSTFRNTRALVIGWGRIGKCLARLLQHLDCQVTVAARKSQDRAILQALGYTAIGTAEPAALSKYGLIYNTVPEIICQQEVCPDWGSGVKIDLASRQGLIGSDVVWARGLPGIHAPESSGTLIAKTILHYIKEEHR